jgi:hypothetical protein
LPFRHCIADCELDADGVADEARTELEALVVLDGLTLLEAPLLLPQLPKPDWQPLPQ